MKKLLCLCLAAGILLSVCACHKTGSGTTQPPPAVSETTAPAEGDGQTADDAAPPEQAQDQPASPSGS